LRADHDIVILADMAGAPEVLWYRCGSPRWITSSLWAFLGLFLGGIAISTGVTGSGGLPMIAVGIVVLLLTALIMRQFLRCGLGVAADHLILRQEFRSREIPWADIAGFERARPPGWRSGTVIVVVCRDKRRLYSSGCSPDGSGNGNTRAAQLVRDLDAARRARTLPAHP